MPRFLVERTMAGGLAIPATAAGKAACRRVVEASTAAGATWLHSFVSEDLETMICVYDGPTEDAVRAASERSGLPVDRIRRVTILDPWFYTGLVPEETC
jgi:hypothetical protein